jgi:hypothetical protein
MKVLVATARTQGERGNDFTWAVDGELVHLGFVCARDQLNPDGGCGCARAFSGLSSRRATTTAEVRDIDFSAADYVLAVRSGLEAAGWSTDNAEAIAAELLDLAADYRVGVVLERRLDDIQARTFA